MTKSQDHTDIAIIKEQVNTIRLDVKDIRVKLEADYVTRDQFEPIQRLVYGMVSLVLISVVGAVLALIFKR